MRLYEFGGVVNTDKASSGGLSFSVANRKLSVCRVSAVAKEVPIRLRRENMRRFACMNVEGDRESSGTPREGDRAAALAMHREVVPTRWQPDFPDEIAALAQNQHREIPVWPHRRGEDQRLAGRQRRGSAGLKSLREQRTGAGKEYAPIDDHSLVAVQRVEAGRQARPDGNVTLEEIAEAFQHDGGIAELGAESGSASAAPRSGPAAASPCFRLLNSKSGAAIARLGRR